MIRTLYLILLVIVVGQHSRIATMQIMRLSSAMQPSDLFEITSKHTDPLTIDESRCDFCKLGLGTKQHSSATFFRGNSPSPTRLIYRTRGLPTRKMKPNGRYHIEKSDARVRILEDQVLYKASQSRWADKILDRNPPQIQKPLYRTRTSNQFDVLIEPESRSYNHQAAQSTGRRLATILARSTITLYEASQYCTDSISQYKDQDVTIKQYCLPHRSHFKLFSKTSRIGHPKYSQEFCHSIQWRNAMNLVKLSPTPASADVSALPLRGSLDSPTYLRGCLH